LIIKWLHRRLIRWQYYERPMGLPAPGRTLEQEAAALWAQPTKVLVDWQGSCARRVTVYRQEKAGCLRPARYVTVIGILVAREDIERELAQMPRTSVESVTAGNQPRSPENPLPKQPSKKTTLKDWLPDAIKSFPRPRGEKDYAGYLLKRAPQKWSKHSIQNVLSELTSEKKSKRKKG
jgi:hypothetical protein